MFTVKTQGMPESIKLSLSLSIIKLLCSKLLRDIEVWVIKSFFAWTLFCMSFPDKICSLKKSDFFSLGRRVSFFFQRNSQDCSLGKKEPIQTHNFEFYESQNCYFLEQKYSGAYAVNFDASGHTDHTEHHPRSRKHDNPQYCVVHHISYRWAQSWKGSLSSHGCSV